MFSYFRLANSGEKPKRQTMDRRRVCLAGAVLAASAAIASIGCDSSTFLPPPPDGLRSAAPDDLSSNANVPVPPGLEGAYAGARSVEIILDRRDPSEIEEVKTAVRTQAGIDKVKQRTAVLAEQDLPGQQVELVREAIARNALVLIVEPADPTDSRMAEVLQKAREDQIPVVLLNRPLTAPGSRAAASKGAESTAKGSAAAPPPASPGANPLLPFAGAKPLVLVTPPSFTASAHQLVALAIRNAKNARLDPKGGAIIVINTIGDPFLHERTEAIRDALKKSGITTVEEITFHKPVEVGAKLLTEKLKANPKLVLVFAVDSVSTAACRQVTGQLIPDRLFVQSAYAAESSYGDMTATGDFAAVAAFAPTRLIRRAITTAVNLAEGRNVPARVEVPIEVRESPEDSSTPQSPMYYRSKAVSKKGS
jgi:ABC-type sugar transport system substrate-binding protein